MVEEKGNVQTKTGSRNLPIIHFNKELWFYTKKDILLQYKKFFAKPSFLKSFPAPMGL